MITKWLEGTHAYDGSQLRPHWIRRTTGVIGDALVAFRGPCEVRESEMVDLEDLLSGPGIAGGDMVHFIWELFDDGDSVRGVLRQRLLAANVLAVLRKMAPTAALHRDGDDIYLDDRKLTISVATRSLVSTLIHFAANVTNENTPVSTVSLNDLGVDPSGFAASVLAAAEREELSLHRARCQVRPRHEGELGA